MHAAIDRMLVQHPPLTPGPQFCGYCKGLLGVAATLELVEQEGQVDRRAMRRDRKRKALALTNKMLDRGYPQAATGGPTAEGRSR